MVVHYQQDWIVWRWLDVMCEVLHPDDEELCRHVTRIGHQRQCVVWGAVVQFMVDLLPWENHGRRNIDATGTAGDDDGYELTSLAGGDFPDRPFPHLASHLWQLVGDSAYARLIHVENPARTISLADARLKVPKIALDLDFVKGGGSAHADVFRSPEG